MRVHKNQSFFADGSVNEAVVTWSIEDYDSAISNSEPDNSLRDELLNERAVLLGVDAMVSRIDEVADSKRMQFLGDVTRAFEYQAAEQGAKSYAAAAFSGDVPEPVQAWADAAGMTTKQAAESILQEAALYNYALNAIRALRLQGKQAVKSATTAEQAQAAYMQTIAAIQAIGR